jgi:acyl-coenzyme A synthetase/AMP-(fatty) acid ligase
MVTHANVHRLFGATRTHFEFSERDVWSLFHSYAFDFSVWELWGALFHGGRLVIVPYWVARSPGEFHRLLEEQHVTVLNQTPSAFMQLLSVDSRERGGLSALRYIIFGGEALDFRTLRGWFDRHGPHTRLINLYGITETTVHVTAHVVEESELESLASRIGVSLDDLQTYVLDEGMQPVPVGVAGELYVGGAGLARGYAGRPGLTAARFVPNPFSDRPGQRLYRSGDLARYRPDGTLEYLGRIDTQVQLRGFRVELGEIEHALRQLAGVSEAVVNVYRSEGRGDGVLVAYVASGSGEPLDPGALRGGLQSLLPDYMVPAYYVSLEALPLTANGKVDRKSLPAPEAQALSRREYKAPETATERLLVEVWSEALKLPAEQIGVHDNFFQLGGHSLLAIQVLTKVQQRASVYAPLKLLFEKPTIAALAEFAETHLMEQDVFGELVEQAEDVEVERGVI